MTVVNTKKVNGVYVPESVEMDPYSEFDYVPEPAMMKEDEGEQQEQKLQESPQQAMKTVMNDIDNFFDGVDMVLGLINHTHKRLIGGQHARRRTRDK